MKKQRGYSLMEVALVMSVIAILTAVVSAGYARMSDRSKVEQTRQVSAQLLDVMQQRLKTGQAITAEAMVLSESVPTSLIRGAVGSYSLVGPLSGTLVPAAATLDAAPSNQTVQLRINGLSPGQCVGLVNGLEGSSDELGVLDGATLTVVKRRGTATPIVFSNATATTACQGNTNTKALMVERKV